jgi:hypothetical protein
MVFFENGDNEARRRLKMSNNLAFGEVTAASRFESWAAHSAFN